MNSNTIKAKINGVVNNTVDATAAQLKKARDQVKSLRAERDAEAARAQAALDELEARKAAEPNMQSAVRDRLSAAYEEFVAEYVEVGWKRRVCGMVFGLTLSYGVGWLIGNVMGWLIAGALMLTGSAFLATVIFVLGMVCAALAGWFVGSIGYGYITSGKAEEHISTVKNTVTGWFKRSDVQLA